MKKIVPQYCTIIDNQKLDRSGEFLRLKVKGFLSTRPIYAGQFVHVKASEGTDPLFRRAFSIADYDKRKATLEIIYKTVGRVTALLAQKSKGEQLSILGPLGNRFSTLPRRQTAVLVAGGVGLPPLYFLAKQLILGGHKPRQILFFYGAQSKNQLLEIKRLRALGVDLIACTDDGSYGFPGLVVDGLRATLPELDSKDIFIYGCGPEPMLAALQKVALEAGLNGELSLEAPMPCGVGVCLGCIKSRRGKPNDYVRICHDGPVFKIGEVEL